MVRPVDPSSWKPKYVQVADDLRDRISAGEYPAGRRLPSEADLGHMYEVNTKTVRRALAVLEADRLVLREAGVRALVRESEERTTVDLNPGDKSINRVPTDAERKKHSLGPHDLVTEITRADGSTEVRPALEVELVVPEPLASED